jgi:hypothetical protein
VTNPALVEYLLANRGGARWIVAVSGAQAAADIQLAAGAPVMAMGGFSGGDRAPTLGQLQAYVRSGALRYVLLGGGSTAGRPFAGGSAFGGPNGASGLATSIWVGTACTPVTTVGVAGLYDCAGAEQG